jgi:hypothetical protein
MHTTLTLPLPYLFPLSKLKSSISEVKHYLQPLIQDYSFVNLKKIKNQFYQAIYTLEWSKIKHLKMFLQEPR